MGITKGIYTRYYADHIIYALSSVRPENCGTASSTTIPSSNPISALRKAPAPYHSPFSQSD